MRAAAEGAVDGALVVILGHEFADFDCVASQVGMAALLPGAIPVLPQRLNENVADFLVLYGRRLPLMRREALPRRPIAHAWYVDTHSAQAVRGMDRGTPRSLVDHHTRLAEPRAPGADADWVERDVQAVGATATLVCERMLDAGHVPGPIEATLLLLGIHEDTGSLCYPSTTARDARAVAWLLETGADLSIARRFLHPPLSPAGDALLRRLIEGSAWHDLDGHDVVLAEAEAADLGESISGVVQRLLETLDPDAVLALVALEGHVQFVGRSASDAIDVAAAAEALGGGGHPRAAAAVVNAAPEAARERLLALMADGSLVGEITRVAQIMSPAPLRVLAPESRVSEALVLARQHGHEGYPVVEDGAVVGMITRATLDLAAHHHLHQQRVAELLAGSPPVIEPGQSVARLRRLMTRDDVGQVAVVEAGRLVGIVTRTDLLAYAREQSRRRHTTGHRVDLAAALDAEHLAAVHAVHALAQERQERIYLVGGLPRDLVLGRDHRADIDLVVVGDAVELAQAAAEELGGEAVRHGRFGTAKWRRGTVTIDLVTARAETYDEPGALPTVTAGSLRADLRRRDFTINTLALDLADERFGQVIDLFGGLDDLDQGTLRVLHGLSFVEDPTRILRAARFEQRLGFALDGHSEQLARGAVSWLHAVSGARIANELRQALAEQRPARVLARLDALGALDAIVPGLGFDTDAARVQQRLPETWAAWRALPGGRTLDDELRPSMRLVAWLAGQGPAGRAAAQRLRLGRRERELLAQVEAIRVDRAWQEPEARPSVVHRALAARRPEALAVAELHVDPGAAADRLRDFAATRDDREPLVRGDDLLALASPGPHFGDVLRAVHEAQLDGEVTTHEEAMALARGLLGELDG